MPKFEYRYLGRKGEHRIVVETTKEEAVHVFTEVARRFEEIGLRPAPSATRKTQTRAPPRPPTGPPVNWALIAKRMPSTADVERYIKSLPERRHSNPDISRHFLGRVVKQGGEEGEHRLFFRLQRRIEKARKRLTKSEPGFKFEPDHLDFGKSRTYRWVPVRAPEGTV